MIRRVVARVTLVCFVVMLSGQSVRAAVAEDRVPADTSTAANAHSVTRTELHVAVQTFHGQTVAARKSVNDFLARPDVRTQIRRVGLAPDRVMSRVAMLSDEEILRLQQQVMTADLQKTPAGLSSGAIIAIVAVAVGGSLLLLWLLVQEAESAYYLY